MLFPMSREIPSARICCEVLGRTVLVLVFDFDLICIKGLSFLIGLLLYDRQA